MPDVIRYTPAQMGPAVAQLAENYNDALNVFDRIEDSIEYSKDGAQYESDLVAARAEIAEDEGYFSDISTALQNKTGQVEPYDKSEMAEAINVLPEIVNEDAALVLIDWEGTLLRSYTREEVMVLTELPNPTMLPNYAYADHEWLVFQEWNWSIGGIKNYCQKYGYCPLYVGAIYDTIDHLNHIDYKKGWAKYGTQGNDYLPNLFSRGLHKLSLCKGYNYNYVSQLLKDDSYTLSHIGIPSDFPRNKLRFSSAHGIKNIVLPEDSTGLRNKYNFTSCHGLYYLNISEGITKLSENFLTTCYQLRGVNIPDTVTLLGQGCLQSSAYPKIQIPKSILLIQANAFGFCGGLLDIIIESKPTLENVNAFSVWGTLESTRKFYVPQANLSWFSTETNWADIYAQYQFVAIEDNIEYLESLGFNVDEYKEATQ